MEALSFWFYFWCVMGLCNLASLFGKGGIFAAIGVVISIYWATDQWFKAFPN
jgi:hypothetical protein